MRAGAVERLTTSLQSGRVLLTLALVGLVTAAAFLVAWRRSRRPGVASAAAAVPVVLAGVVLVAPYFDRSELDEALPTSAPGTAPSAQADQRLARAELRGLGGHRASGAVELHRLADGALVLRFADVDIEGTPTPRVHLVPGAGRERPGGVALGALKADRGSFNYALDRRPGSPTTVLVWCERFAVPIAGATLA